MVAKTRSRRIKSVGADVSRILRRASRGREQEDLGRPAEREKCQHEHRKLCVMCDVKSSDVVEMADQVDEEPAVKADVRDYPIYGSTEQRDQDSGCKVLYDATIRDCAWTRIRDVRRYTTADEEERQRSADYIEGEGYSACFEGDLIESGEEVVVREARLECQ